MTIAFLPFLTSHLGEYSEEQVSVVIYIANAALSSMLLISIPWYATARHRLSVLDVDEDAVRFRHAQRLAVPVVILISIGISFSSPRAAMYSWLLVIVTDPHIRRLWFR